MIPLGLSPLFTHSIIAYSKNNTGKYFEHKIRNNNYYFDDKIINSLSYQDSLQNLNKKIAILINNKTASQGEFLAYVLKSQIHTKSFGSKTNGLMTGIQTYHFNSGAEFGFSTTYMCNKNKQILHDGLTPDVTCSNEDSLKLAIEWINSSI